MKPAKAWPTSSRRGELGDYSDQERVFDEKGQVRSYLPGSFIYRQAGRDRQKLASFYTPEVLTRCLLIKDALKELLEGGEGRIQYTGKEILGLTICEPAMVSAAFLNEAINAWPLGSTLACLLGPGIENLTAVLGDDQAQEPSLEAVVTSHAATPDAHALQFHET